MYAVKIGTDNVVQVVDFPADDSYNFIKDCVHGWIEVVDFDFGQEEFSLWLNEEGKLIGLDVNDLATTLVEHRLFNFDYIVGDCVVTGTPDEEGNTTGLTLEDAGFLALNLMIRV